MADWEQDIVEQGGRHVPPSIPARPSPTTRHQQTRQPQAEAEDDPFAAHAPDSYRSAGASQSQSQQQQQQQHFVHPLLSEPLHPSMQQPQQHQPQSFQPHPSPSQHLQPPTPPSDPAASDPSLRRIEQSLRSSLTRDPTSSLTAPSSSSSSKHLPPLSSRPAAPSLKLGEVIHRVLGPRPHRPGDQSTHATSSDSSHAHGPGAVPSSATSSRSDPRLVGLVRSMRLHESIVQAESAAKQDAQARAERAALAQLKREEYVVGEGGMVEYDENDDEVEDAEAAAAASASAASTAASPSTLSPLPQISPRRSAAHVVGVDPNLPTSRIPIAPEDLARRPEDILEQHPGIGIGMGGRMGMEMQQSEAERILHFRRNIAERSGGGGAPTMAASVTNTGDMGASMHGPAAATGTFAAGVGGGGGWGGVSSSSGPTDTFVESKTTGEFIRVRGGRSTRDGTIDPRILEANLEMDLGSPGMDPSTTTTATSSAHAHRSALEEYEAGMDGVLLRRVDQIQAGLSGVGLMMAGLVAGACLLQVYLIYLKSSDRDFLSYYSPLAGPCRKVIYVVLGFSSILSVWRCSLERLDLDRHRHFQTRYFRPNSNAWIRGRTLLTGGVFMLAFLLTTLMMPLDDYIESRWIDAGNSWFDPSAVPELPSYFNEHIDDWYRMAVARLVLVAIGWACMMHRFARAEYQALELEQEKQQQQRTSVHAGGWRNNQMMRTGQERVEPQAQAPVVRWH